MSTVDSTTLSTSGTQMPNSSSSNSSTGGTSSMGENDFLQLMMDQLSNQDPLNPDDPTQYVSELAQFSSLEEETNVATADQNNANQTASTEALALVGKQVTYTDNNGNDQTGTVSSVSFTSSGPTLTIGSDSGIALSNITGAS
jgi:flagellar basal-body rod modification protein FlgD